MRLCFGSYLAVLVSCKAIHVDNKDLCEALLHSVAPDFEFTYEGQLDADRVREDNSSKLLRCEQNLSPDITNPARTADPQEVAVYFKKNVLPLLDGNRRKHIILVLKDIIANDQPVRVGNKFQGIDDDTRVDKVGGVTKKMLASQTAFCFHEFLAGVFLYTTAINNRSGKDTIKSVTVDYILSFSSRIDEVTLIEKEDSKQAALISAVRESNLSTESANEIAGNLIDRLAPLVKPDRSLLVTLLAEANGKCLHCGKELGAPKRGSFPIDNCEITYLTQSADEIEEYGNAVALCKGCAPLVSNFTVSEKSKLLEDKYRLAESLILLDEISGIRIAKEIEAVLREIDKIKNLEGLAEIDITELVNIDNKIYELSLREVINTRMKRLYKTVKEICGRLEQEIGFDTDKFGRSMKFIFETLEDGVRKNTNITDPQEYVANILVSKLYSQIGQKYKAACEIIVAYLVKRCDLFNAYAKQS